MRHAVVVGGAVVVAEEAGVVVAEVQLSSHCRRHLRHKLQDQTPERALPSVLVSISNVVA